MDNESNLDLDKYGNERCCENGYFNTAHACLKVPATKMPKLPQHIEKRLYEIFDNTLIEGGFTMDDDSNWISEEEARMRIKSFIATILEEERERIVRIAENKSKVIEESTVKGNREMLDSEAGAIYGLKYIINLIKVKDNE